MISPSSWRLSLLRCPLGKAEGGRRSAREIGAARFPAGDRQPARVAARRPHPRGAGPEGPARLGQDRALQQLLLPEVSRAHRGAGGGDAGAGAAQAPRGGRHAPARPAGPDGGGRPRPAPPPAPPPRPRPPVRQAGLLCGGNQPPPPGPPAGGGSSAGGGPAGPALSRPAEAPAPPARSRASSGSTGSGNARVPEPPYPAAKGRGEDLRVRELTDTGAPDRLQDQHLVALRRRQLGWRRVRPQAGRPWWPKR